MNEMKNKKRLQVLLQLSLTDGQIDAQKVAAISSMLSKRELTTYYKAIRKFHFEHSVDVFTPAALDKTVTEKLSELFEGQDVTFEIDPGLLAGMKVRVGDTVFDSSLQFTLEKVKDEYGKN